MPTVNEGLLDASVRHMVWLERYKTGTVYKIIALLNRADDDLADLIAARLVKIEARGYDLGPAETKRLQALLDDLRAERTKLYALTDEKLRDELVDFSHHEADFQARLIEAAVDTVTLQRPSLSQLRAVVVAQPFRGRVLKDWAASLAQEDVKRLSDAIKIGIVEGQTTDQIVRRVRGTKAAGYADGVMEISRRGAAAVVRTSIAHTANLSSEELYALNADIVKGVQWVSTLDSRTTPVCQSRDGKVYKINEGPRPPAHWNCRSRTVPFLGQTSIPGTRASAIGPVPGNLTYGDWLRSQPAKVQDEVLGPARGQLFRKGGMTVDRFVDQTGHAYTLKELKRRDAESWQQTFGS
jgi:SPP1 gp7 family putative phage head morphogenesis protein